MSRLIMPSILNQGVEGGKVFIAAIHQGALYKYEGGQWLSIPPVGGSPVYRWGSISDDGKKWIIPIYAGRLYLWDGAQYIEQQPAGNSDRNWQFACISGDGKRILAGIYGGRLYYFDGSGWAQVQPAGNSDRNWFSGAISFNGTKYMAGIDNGRLYRYDGSQFIEEQPVGNIDAQFMALAMDNAGNSVVAGRLYARIYEKTVGGSWSEVQPAGNINRLWRQASISSKGFKHYISGWAGTNGFTYFYNGSSWIDEGIFNGISANVSGAMAHNGRRIIAGTNNRLYINMHDGNGYVEHTPAGNSNQNWIHVMTNKGI